METMQKHSYLARDENKKNEKGKNKDKVYMSVSHLSKTYLMRHDECHALDKVSFDIKEGEFIVVVGPSGCGKSTLLMIIAGLTPKTQGVVKIEGRSVEGPQTNVGIVFQNSTLLPWRTSIKNVMLQIEMRELKNEKYESYALELLESVGLKGFENKYPFELSGGMCQRVSICRALVHNPPFLLMDEPFGALDALTREQMRIDVEKLLLKKRKTVLFITHSIQEAVILADKIIVMTPRPGQIDKIININLPRPRNLKIQGSTKFLKYCETIRDIFLSKGVLKY